ncbi:MAG TPA: hypothetical protein VNG33_13740, partial [Polyangiaceae bacterium]|nr:hypothetical protein [Polyangiaceae bacterium]
MSRRAARFCLLAFTALGCKHEDEARPIYPLGPAQPVQTAPPPVVANPTPGGVPAPSPPSAPSMPPAFGFFCATDNDAQCPFARCVSGRCGGCSSQAECKPNTQCVPSFVGQLCLPAVANSQPSAPPVNVPV